MSQRALLGAGLLLLAATGTSAKVPDTLAQQLRVICASSKHSPKVMYLHLSCALGDSLSAMLKL